MEYETLTTRAPRYPRRFLERLKEKSPTLYCHGPLRLLDRFNLTVIAADCIAGQALMAMSETFLTVRQYAMNFIGPWQSVGEMEVFTYVLETKYDPDRRRSLTACTARGLQRENWDNFLGDRFGYKADIKALSPALPKSRSSIGAPGKRNSCGFPSPCRSNCGSNASTSFFAIVSPAPWLTRFTFCTPRRALIRPCRSSGMR
jgi:hypothetical protein